jgi:hypothetical protein
MLSRSFTGAILLTALAGPLAGQEPVGPEFRIDTFRLNSQTSPAVSGAADGKFVVVWQSFGRDDRYWAVAGQRFDRLGRRLGTEFLVNTFTWASQRLPAVASDPTGRFVVAWQSEGQDGDRDGIFARRYDAAGNPLDSSEFQVNAYTTHVQAGVDVGADVDGNFVIVWESVGQDGYGRGLFGRRFSADGAALGGEFAVTAYTAREQEFPAIDVLPGGGFVVVWHSTHQGPGSDVFARRFDPEGLPLGPEVQVNSYTTLSQLIADVAADRSGGFVVVWVSGQDGDHSGIFGQRFDAAGNRLGAEFMANTYTAYWQSSPSVAVDPGGGFVVVWYSYRQDGSHHGIFGQRFDAAGNRIGTEFQVNSHTTGGQEFPKVASLGTEKFVVAWHSDGVPDGREGIFGQRYGDVLFRDGFETGDTSRWSATAADDGDLSVSAAAALKSTSAGLAAFVDDRHALYVEDDTPGDEDLYRARFYFDPHDFDPGEAQGRFRNRIFMMLGENPTRRLAVIVLRRQGGQYSVIGRARRDDGSRADTGFFPIAAGPHVVEVRWARATGPGGNDGIFELWLDGTLVASNTTLDNDLGAVDFVRLGALSIKAGASGTLYFDEFESRRETDIGP